MKRASIVDNKAVGVRLAQLRWRLQLDLLIGRRSIGAMATAAISSTSTMAGSLTTPIMSPIITSAASRRRAIPASSRSRIAS
jgi:hypothetical protein